MEKHQEQLKRGLTRAVLKHGWLPRLCTVASRLSLDDYIRPHVNGTSRLSDPGISRTIRDLTRRLSESHSQSLAQPRENVNGSVVTPLPWNVLKNTAIPSVAEFLRRTLPIDVPVPSTSAPNFPGAGFAALTNRSSQTTESVEIQVEPIQTSTTSISVVPVSDYSRAQTTTGTTASFVHTTNLGSNEETISSPEHESRPISHRQWTSTDTGVQSRDSFSTSTTQTTNEITSSAVRIREPRASNECAPASHLQGRHTPPLPATSRTLSVQASCATLTNTRSTQSVQMHMASETQGVADKANIGVQVVQDVSTKGTQSKLNTYDASTEILLCTSSHATQCNIEVKTTGVQAVPKQETTGTQYSIDTVETGSQAVVSTKSTSTQTDTPIYKGKSVQCEINQLKDETTEILNLSDHITDLVQQYSDTINSEVADISQKEIIKQQVLKFLENFKVRVSKQEIDTILPGPSSDISPAKQESCGTQTSTNISHQMSPQPVTNLKTYLRDSFPETSGQISGLFNLSDEGPPSTFIVPEDDEEAAGCCDNREGDSWMYSGAVKDRSEAQSPLYCHPSQLRSQTRFKPHQPITPGTPQATDNFVQPMSLRSTLNNESGTAHELYDDGSGFKVPNVPVQLLQEGDISWRLKSDGTCVILGIGSFGSVAAATLRNPNGTTVDVAVKKHRFERDRRSFIREGKMNSFLSDTGVFPEFFGFLYLGTQNNPVICLVSELYGNGTTLADCLEQNNLGSLRAWMSISLQLAEGLLKIHEKNVIFNDIKANNVLVNMTKPEEPVVKYIDVGMSSYMHGITYNFTVVDLRTVPHLAPEVKLKQPTSVLSDIWGLGLTYWDIAQVSRLPGLREVARAALQDNPEERISLKGLIDTLLAIGRCHSFL